MNRGFNIYDNKRIGTIPASVAEELLGIELQEERLWLYVKVETELGLLMFPMV